MNERFSYLLVLYIENRISSNEHDEFFDMVSSGKYDAILEEKFPQITAESDMLSHINLPDHISHDLVRNILNSDNQTINIKRGKIISLAKRWLVAASLFMIAAAGIYFIDSKINSNRFVDDFVKTSRHKRVNNTNDPMAIVLPDGSNIVLQPKSSLYYSLNNYANKREVYMEGEAFFKIAKNPLKPFYVYYNKVVTKVLGTSFNIKTNKGTGYIEVEVVTGKVQVYENEQIVHKKQDNMSLIITPNQKAIYQTDKLFFEAALVDRPMPITAIDDEVSMVDVKPKAIDFNFENTKLSEVLQKLEDAYGLEIIVNNEEMYNCVFSGDVTKQNLFDKLKIICLATNSSYEVNGTKILLKGYGCKNLTNLK